MFVLSVFCLDCISPTFPIPYVNVCTHLNIYHPTECKTCNALHTRHAFINSNMYSTKVFCKVSGTPFRTHGPTVLCGKSKVRKLRAACDNGEWNECGVHGEEFHIEKNYHAKSCAYNLSFILFVYSSRWMPAFHNHCYNHRLPGKYIYKKSPFKYFVCQKIPEIFLY